MRRITEHRRRFGLVVFAALLAMALSLFTVVNHPAYAGVSGCNNGVGGVQSGSVPSGVWRGSTQVANAYLNIDYLYNSSTGQWCGMRARADIFPVQYQVVYGGFRVELCFNTPAVYGCEMGGLSEIIGGSQFSYTCPHVYYPNHCAVVGPWVSPPNYFCHASVDGAVFPYNTNSWFTAYSWVNNWC
jgi:hypothetical protein